MSWGSSHALSTLRNHEQVRSPTDPLFESDYDRIRSWSRTNAQFRLARSQSTVPLTLHWVLPSDNSHDDQLYFAKIDELSLGRQALHWFGFVNDPTWPLDAGYIEENASRMATRNFNVGSLSPLGPCAYSDLAGAWLRLRASGDYWVVHDVGGYLDGEGSLPASERIVLIMRWDHNEDGYPDRPLPYPARLIGGRRLHAGLRRGRPAVEDVLPGDGTERAMPWKSKSRTDCLPRFSAGRPFSVELSNGETGTEPLSIGTSTPAGVERFPTTSDVPAARTPRPPAPSSPCASR